MYRLRVTELSTLFLEMRDDSTSSHPITLTVHVDRNNNQLPEDDELVANWYNTTPPLSECAQPGEYFISVLGGQGLYTLTGGVSAVQDAAKCSDGL